MPLISLSENRARASGLENGAGNALARSFDVFERDHAPTTSARD